MTARGAQSVRHARVNRPSSDARPSKTSTAMYNMTVLRDALATRACQRDVGGAFSGPARLGATARKVPAQSCCHSAPRAHI